MLPILEPTMPPAAVAPKAPRITGASAPPVAIVAVIASIPNQPPAAPPQKAPFPDPLRPLKESFNIMLHLSHF